MSARSEVMLHASRTRLWGRRAIGVFGICAITLGIFVLVQDVLSPDPDLPPGNTIVFIFVFVAGLVYLLVGTLRFNLMGVWSEGIAPPMKPLRALLQEPFIFRWEDITSIELHPERSAEKPPRQYSVEFTTAHGDRIRFGSDLVGNRFGSETRVRQLYSLLALSEGGHGKPDFRISGLDPQVERVLSAKWPDTGAYRRTKASWAGIIVGGTVTLVAFWFYGLGEHEQVWRGVFIASGFVFLWSLLSPGLFRRRAASELADR